MKRNRVGTEAYTDTQGISGERKLATFREVKKMRGLRFLLLAVLLILLGVAFDPALITLAFTANNNWPAVRVNISQWPTLNSPTWFACADGPMIYQADGYCAATEPTPDDADSGEGLLSEIGVYLHSGELWYYAVDLEIPGRGFNWKFERRYLSGVIFRGPMGSSWEFNYNRRLMEVNLVNLQYIRENTFPQVKVGDVVRMDGYGRADLYVRNPDGSYTAPAGFYMKLVRNPDGTFVERDRVGNKAFYLRPDSEGLARLSALSDRNGNTMRFQYNAQNQLVRVLDTLGRPIDYRYSAEGLLVEVRDFLGRAIRFEYDTQIERIGPERHPRFNLVAVTTPAVTGTPNGNDFPQGKTVRYTYSADFDRERLNHNLLTITAPNEVATGGPPRVVVTYDTNPNSPNVDRVLSLTIAGTNRTGIPAGGTIRYEYQAIMRTTERVLDPSEYSITRLNLPFISGTFLALSNIREPQNATNVTVIVRAIVNGMRRTFEETMDIVNGQGSRQIRLGDFNADVRVEEVCIRFSAPPAPDDFNIPVFQNTVTDRNGNRTEYQFNQLGNIVRRREFTNRKIRPGDPEFFETRYEYNKDGELTKVIYPEGNTVEYVYDDTNPDRFQQGNLLSEIRRPDPKRGGDQAFIKTTYAYEPIYNQLARVTEARGNDPSYVPQNGGANSPQRYTTVYTFDYQEGTNFAALARELGISEAEVRARLERAGIPMGLGDINKDGRTDQINGNVIRIERPTVQLLPACPGDEITEGNINCSLQARLEGTSQQPIVEFYHYNQFGQMTKRIDPEGNIL
jgi:YD repeat-containing protein